MLTNKGIGKPFSHTEDLKHFIAHVRLSFRLFVDHTHGYVPANLKGQLIMLVHKVDAKRLVLIPSKERH
ncbi:hypothetical protein RB195_011287 [Necator americanus]|uniref:Uncharacterized protein n=1 Tax=Necator americanus TaxID=51031 RepID=A0ABR1D2W8_NECAM